MLKLKKAQERGLGLGKFIVSSIFEIISKAHQPCMRGYSNHFRLSHPIAGRVAAVRFGLVWGQNLNPT